MSEAETKDDMTLRNCPFCDGRAELVNSLPSQTDGYYYVKCTSCETSGNSFDEQEEAVTAWNTRVSEGSQNTVSDSPKSESVLKMECLLGELRDFLTGFIHEGHEIKSYSIGCQIVSFGSLELDVKCVLNRGFRIVPNNQQYGFADVST